MDGATSAWSVGVSCALCLVVAPSAVRAQAGVLVRHDSGEVECSPESPQTHEGAACAEIACDADRACVQLPDVGARCIDPEEEIVCVEGTRGCDDCPLNTTTGADPEACLVIALPQGSYSLCLYDPRWVCLEESVLDAASCAGTDGFSSGDCDGDGVPNGADRCLCERGDEDAGGCPASDGGIVDGGASLDAGTSEADASSAPGDPPIEPLFRGGGGCACTIGLPKDGAPQIAWLALLLLARTRAAARRRPLFVPARRPVSSRTAS